MGKIRNPEFNEKANKFNNEVIQFFTDYILLELPEGVPAWVAGGALRDFLMHGYIKEDTDIDIFTDSQTNFDKIRKEFNNYYNETEESKTAVTFFDKEGSEKKVQLIKIFYPSPMECINSFDFLCCCAYVGYLPTKDGTRSNDAIMDAAEEFYEDNCNKTLRVLRLNDNPTVTLARVQKYIKKGYAITDYEKLGIFNAYIHGHRQLEEITEEYGGLLTINK
jgi:hypothetical protein